MKNKYKEIILNKLGELQKGITLEDCKENKIYYDGVRYGIKLAKKTVESIPKEDLEDIQDINNLHSSRRPLEFKELKAAMRIWDDYVKEYVTITSIGEKYSVFMNCNNGNNIGVIYKEDRFYKERFGDDNTKFAIRDKDGLYYMGLLEMWSRDFAKAKLYTGYEYPECLCKKYEFLERVARIVRVHIEEVEEL